MADVSRRHPAALTHDEATALDDSDTVTQVVLHPAMLVSVVDWLDRRGIDLVPYASEDDKGDVPTYIACARLG